MNGRLIGKTAIITGGTSGIGRRTVEIFAQEGASVLIAARREKEGRELAEALGPQVDFLKTDVSREADVKAMIDYAVKRFGRLDCLFNNAGCPAPVGSIETIPLDKYEAALSVLLGGVMLGMKHAAPVMRAQGSGSIINNGSVAGVLAGYSSSMIYAAAKAAVIHLTKCVAMEMGENEHPGQLHLTRRHCHRYLRKGLGLADRGGRKKRRSRQTGLGGHAAHSPGRSSGGYRSGGCFSRFGRINLCQRP